MTVGRTGAPMARRILSARFAKCYNEGEEEGDAQEILDALALGGE
jgi:hypothetical protein